MAKQLRPVTQRLAVLSICGLLACCGLLAPPPQVRGNHVDADQLKQLTPGTSTRADATALLGSPTARATFDDNTWLYISERTRPQIGATQAVVSQEVVVLTFNEQGVLQNVDTKGESDSLPTTVVARTTPSPGTEASFMQQLFGNIGRFSAAPTPTGPSGGAPAPY
ncbi:MAG: outer membrane protein assembly factor BamE [Acetobacteraceae bacterium]|nr:outer membrane protein assembly factor BamE [Acetobacteraceae bacterium]